MPTSEQITRMKSTVVLVLVTLNYMIMLILYGLWAQIIHQKLKNLMVVFQ